jgi:hypothetical protein
MNSTSLTYKAQLELESLKFLEIVNESDKQQEAQQLANVLTGKMFIHK